MKKFGFTLAEVLITLGIIGIVAAMTLPALTGAYRKHVVETELKKSYTFFNQLIRRSEVDNESAVTWDWSATVGRENSNKFFDRYFAPYLQITDRRSPVTGSGRWYYVYDSAGSLLWYYSNSNLADWVRLSDGRVILFSLSGRSAVDYGSLGVILPSSGRHSNLVTGRDVFAFTIYVNKDKSLLSVAPKTYQNWSCNNMEKNREEHIKYCKTTHPSSGIAPSDYCTMLIYCNNWKIPKDYPIKI